MPSAGGHIGLPSLQRTAAHHRNPRLSRGAAVHQSDWACSLNVAMRLRPSPCTIKRHPLVAAAAAAGSGAGGSFSRRGSRSERRARQPGMFEVKVVTPPPRSLGIYALPPNTHNGEQIEIDGEGYVVTSLVLQYKLVKGKYVRDHNKLEVQPTSRYFLNMMLDNLVTARYIGPTGSQD